MATPSRLDCREAVARLDDYVDRELGPEEVERVRTHLECCTHCAGVYAFEAGILSELKAKLRRIAAPPDLMKRILARLEGDPGRPGPA